MDKTCLLVFEKYLNMQAYDMYFVRVKDAEPVYDELWRQILIRVCDDWVYDNLGNE